MQSIQKVSNMDEAIERANKNNYGLAAAVFTQVKSGLQIKKDVFIISRLNSQLIHSGYWKGHLRQQQPQSWHRLGKVQILNRFSIKELYFSNICR